MLDNKVPRSKLGPSPRATSFFIDNLLGTPNRRASVEQRKEREENPGFRDTEHGTGVFLETDTGRLDETSPSTPRGTETSEKPL